MKIFKNKDKKDKKNSPSTPTGSSNSPNGSPNPSSLLLTNQQKYPVNEKYINSKVFGKKLPADPNDLPPFVLQAMDYLDEHCLNVEGIFRLSPKKTDEDEVIQVLEQNLRAVINYEKYEIHLPASLLKLYLRELPDPLLTYEQYGMFIAAERIPDEEQRLFMIKKVIKFLPPTNFKIMKKLSLFLNRIAANSSVNKMSPSNLAIVFAPNLLKSDLPQTHMEILQDSKYSTSLMTTLIAGAVDIFAEEDDIAAVEKVPTPVDEVDKVLNYRDRFINRNEEAMSTSNVTKIGPRHTSKALPTIESEPQKQRPLPQPKPVPTQQELDKIALQALGWQEYFDSSSGNYYYHHAESGVTTWNKPDLSAYHNSQKSPPSSRSNSNSSTERETAVDEEPVAKATNEDTAQSSASSVQADTSSQPTTRKPIKIPVRKRGAVVYGNVGSEVKKPLPNPNTYKRLSTQPGLPTPLALNAMTEELKNFNFRKSTQTPTDDRPRASVSGYESDDGCVVGENGEVESLETPATPQD